jgi:putative ABC transport system permease protein
MTASPRRDWAALIRRYARAAGAPLAPATVDELATHLEDVYLAELEGGATVRDAHQAAIAVLEQSGLASLSQLTHDPRPDPRRFAARTAGDTAHATRSRSLAVFYALRMAFRQFRQHPSFALITVLVLGLGTGAAATVYTIVDSVVLRPLPYRAPDRLVALWEANSEKGLSHEPLSPVTFMDYRGLKVFEDAAGWWRPDVNLVDPGLDPVRVKTIETSGNLFDVLGVGAQVGPGFPKAGPFYDATIVAVISDRLWRARYNADPSIIGRQLNLNENMYTIVGVMPAGFNYPGDIDVWERLRWDFTQHSRSAHFVEAVARLAPNATLEQARGEMDALALRLGTQFANSNKGSSYKAIPMLDDQLGYYRPALMVLFGAVGLLLIIGCLNVASLLLTRALAREREIAVRFALGAAPRQLITQLIAESLVLSGAGALAGLVFAFAALPAIIAVTPVPIPRLAEASINPRVLGFALGLVAVTTLIFGLVPALVLVKRQIASKLRAGERGSSVGARRLYHVLVTGEVALACALLIGSALLVRSVTRMTTVPLGVDGKDVVITGVQLSGTAYSDWQKVADVHELILAELRRQPGVRAAGGANFLPFETGWRNPFNMTDQPPANPQDAPQVQQHAVTDGYFEAMGAGLIAGRLFNDRDTSTGEGVAVVNETLAKRFGGGAAIVGKQLMIYSGQIGPLGRNLMAETTPDNHRAFHPLRIVGVVADVRNTALGQPVEAALYYPNAQFPFRSLQIAIAARDTETAVTAMRNALRAVAPNTPPGTVETWAHKAGARTAEPQLLMTTLSAFGFLAALLAALGVYGLFSWSVALRRRELAIRLTLGARPVTVGASVVLHSALLVGIGLIAGWVIVRAAQGPLTTVLFGVTPGDMASTITAAALLFVASLVACVPAALRAMRVNPVDGLRND